jgi:hypothetical protein
MSSDREMEKQEILAMIDRYLADEVTMTEAAGWATLRMGKEKPSQESEDDHIIADGLGALMMLSESEPEEYRTTRKDLLQVRSYLLGEQPFPSERIPKQR